MSERNDGYSYKLEYHHIGGPTRTAGAMGGGREGQLETAREELIEYIRYYTELGDIQITAATIERYCRTCDGRGTVIIRKPRSRKEATCPDCKGKDSTIVTETWISLPRDAFL